MCALQLQMQIRTIQQRHVVVLHVQLYSNVGQHVQHAGRTVQLCRNTTQELLQCNVTQLLSETSTHHAGCHNHQFEYTSHYRGMGLRCISAVMKGP